MAYFFMNLNGRTRAMQATTPALTLEHASALKYFAHYQTGLTLIWFGLLIWFELILEMHVPFLLWALWLPLHTLLSWQLYRIYYARRSLSQNAWFLILTASLALLAGLLYHTGGVINPLSFMLIVPLALGAMLLNRTRLTLLAFLAGGVFWGLSQFYVPLMSLHIQNLNTFFYWHLNGSVAVFLLLTLLIIALFLPMKHQLQSARQTAQTLRNQAVQDEYLLSVATLAAASVHQLSTPLNTLSLIESLMRSAIPEDEKQTYLDLMDAQIQTCDQVLKQLRQQADLTRDNAPGLVNFATFLTTLRQEFALLHPKSELKIHSDLQGQFNLPVGFKLALFNLLNNAARHSPEHIALNIHLTPSNLIFEVEDRGQGIPRETLQQLGQQPLEQAEEMGIGIYLTQTLMERCQGQLSYHSLPQGTLARLSFDRQLFTEEMPS